MNSAMEQTRYWMWARKKLNNSTTRPPPPLFNSPLISSSSSYHESWEEQAFAEDSAGLLGGCIWPPRSYTCSFCRREFRSAQALGGHMNVHRRDRARLKQSSSPIDEDQVRSMEYYSPNPSPNPNPNPSPSPNPNPNSGAIGSSLPSFVNPMPLRLPSALELRLELGSFRVREVGSKGKRDRDKDDEIGVYSNKRQRSTDQQLGFPSIVKPSSGGFQFVSRSTEVLKLSPSPVVEEIDLELRLGDPPKLK